MAFGLCETCQAQSTYEVYASYDIDTNEAHPVLARYPGVQAYSCDEHLSEILIRDVMEAFSTRQWVVRRR